MKSIMAIVAFGLLAVCAARAETTDFAKITCDEITNAYLEDVVVIGA
jgi:hypothetical protein